ncbi:MAG TPA: penicillin-insensitive murein endopeptidase, partial [Nannocystaceae bacterium]|nr:penicillin-insensitive murein endopeptidase [Nannocystaceae bacterium]
MTSHTLSTLALLLGLFAATGISHAGDPAAAAERPSVKPSAKPAAKASPPADDDDHDGDEVGAETPDGIPAVTRAPAHPDCGGRVPLFEHVVRRGEHLGQIAGRYGVRRTDLVALNAALKNPDLIKPGQTIRVCPTIAPRVRKEIEVVVKTGDTAGGIASAHGLTIAELVAMQHGELADPNRLVVGRTLHLVVDGGIVPDFLPPEPPPAAKRGAGGRSRARARTRTTAMVGPGIQLGQSEHWYLKRPHLAWGTPRTIHAIERAVAQYKRQHRGGPKVHIGDISKRGGGALHPHLSHRLGRDVDVGYVLRGADGERTKFSGVTKENLDVARTWA